MPRQTSATRNRLIEAARFLFWERGFAATSMADLLSRADANSGSFYHYFESKEALLRTVLETYRAGLRPAIVEPAFAIAFDPLERIFAILAGYRECILATDFHYGCPLGRLALEVDPENRPVHDLIAENFRDWIGVIRECLANVAPRFCADTDLDSLATFVLVTMEGGVMLSRSCRSVAPFDQAVAQLRSYFSLLIA